MLTATALAAAGLWAGYTALEATLPDVFSFSAYRKLALESSRVYASGGEPIARFGAENRTVVAPAEIPDALRFAIVASEDAAFYHHPGLDLFGIARALWVDVSAGRYKQGASTITQQFAKTRFLSADKRVIRKLKELILARRLEQRASKDEILAMYLNEIYYGHGAYGCEEAARRFFGKPVGQIDLAEAALLAGVVNAPSRLSPFNHPERARTRRAYVLDQMHRRGYIGAEDAERGKRAPLPTETSAEMGVEAPWYVAAVRRQLGALIDDVTLAQGGLRIEIAMDVPAQRAADAAVHAGLLRVDQTLKSWQPLRNYTDDAAMAAGLGRIKQGRRKGDDAEVAIAPGQLLLGVVVSRVAAGSRSGYLVDLGDERGLLRDDALGRYAEAAATTAEALYVRGDLLRISALDRIGGDDQKAAGGAKWLIVAEQGPQAALVAIEPQTRLVRALIGGDDARLHPFHRALDASRQPGSTFKPFVYGAAIEAGLVTADSEFVDEQRSFRSGGRAWTPRNYKGHFDGKKHSLRDALARSINSIAVEVADRVGPAKIAAFAQRMGIVSELRADLPLALGASSVRPIELANAYATIAADGMTAPPILVTRIVDRDGKVRFSAQHNPARAISTDVARALADMLGEVVRRGSARKANVGHPVAGKTGTTNGGRDTWFVGFSAKLCASVWIGYDDRKAMKAATGATFALPMWVEFMRVALDRMPVTPLPRLPHVLEEGIEPPVLEDDPEAGAAILVDEVADENVEPLLEDLAPESVAPPSD